jgi:hypothetical protein
MDRYISNMDMKLLITLYTWLQSRNTFTSRIFFDETGGVTPLLIIFINKSYNNRVQTIKKQKRKRRR